MNIDLSDEQVQEFLSDGCVRIKFGDYSIYMELAQDIMYYFELIKRKNGKTEQGYAFDTTDLDRLKAKRPNDPSFYHNDPLCPNCRSYMLYRFEYCPKCGQKLDWSEK